MFQIPRINLKDKTFETFGTAIFPVDDMRPQSEVEPKLIFKGGDTRFYLMSLKRRTPRINSMTQHLRVTQCLGSAEGIPWWIVVASPKILPNTLCCDQLVIVKVNPGEALKLHLGTWHSGPFFVNESALFFNLELFDTNLNDHNSTKLDRIYQLQLY